MTDEQQPAPATVTMREGAAPAGPGPAAFSPEAVAQRAPIPTGAQLGVPFPRKPDRPVAGVRYEIEAPTGAVLGVKWWTAIERMRFFELLGPQNAMNAGVISVALPAFLITDVAGRQMPPRRPLNRSELEGRIAIIGDVAIEAAWNAIGETLAPDENADELKNE